jgi:hypothetical protein
VKIQPNEIIEEVPMVIQQERLVEVPQIRTVEVTTEVMAPYAQIIEKPFPKIDVQAVERICEVPHIVKKEIAVKQPRLQVVEVIREVPQEHVHQVVKQIPKVELEYCERVVQVPDEYVYQVVQQTPRVELDYCERVMQVSDSPEIAYMDLPLRYVDVNPGLGNLSQYGTISRQATTVTSDPGYCMPASGQSLGTQYSGTAVVDVGTGIIVQRNQELRGSTGTFEAATTGSYEASVGTQFGTVLQPIETGSVAIGMGVGTFGEGFISERVVGDVPPHIDATQLISVGVGPPGSGGSGARSPVSRRYFNVLGRPSPPTTRTSAIA